MSLDLSFLHVRLAAHAARPRPVNVYDVLREGWRETRVDMTLQFFLDPSERHGFGSMVIDALLTAFDGAPTIGRTGSTEVLFEAEESLGSETWDVNTQVDFIDVFAVNRELGLAVVLENKVGHILNNPLDKYALRALSESDVDTVLMGVLAPEHRDPPPSQRNWLSRSITYDELADEIRRSPRLVEFLMRPTDQNQRRSIDLLQQFIEARSGATDMTEIQNEAAAIEEWRDLVSEHREAIKRFDDSKRRAGRLLRDRNKRLEPMVDAAFEELGLSPSTDFHGGSGSESWNAYRFEDLEWTVELKLSINPDQPCIFVYDYEGQAYKRSTVESLRLGWETSDQEIASAFANRVVTILAQVRSGQRPPAVG